MQTRKPSGILSRLWGGWGFLVDATPQNVGDIRDREFVLPEKVGQSSPKFLGDATF